MICILLKKTAMHQKVSLSYHANFVTNISLLTYWLIIRLLFIKYQQFCFWSVKVKFLHYSFQGDTAFRGLALQRSTVPNRLHECFRHFVEHLETVRNFHRVHETERYETFGLSSSCFRIKRSTTLYLELY